jgi:hypothetical protein
LPADHIFQFVKCQAIPSLEVKVVALPLALHRISHSAFMLHLVMTELADIRATVSIDLTHRELFKGLR